MDELGRSPALARRWSRMCLVREAMEGTRVPAAAPDFCAGVMAAIAQQGGSVAERPAKVVSLPARSRPAAANAPRWQPFAGLAIAASVAAVVAVGGYRWLSQPVGAPAQTAQAPAAGAPLQPAGFTASAGTVPEPQLVPVSSGSAEPVETRWSQLDAATARQLNEYMLEHANMRAEQGVSSALSYPRMTLHTAEYRASGERR